MASLPPQLFISLVHTFVVIDFSSCLRHIQVFVILDSSCHDQCPIHIVHQTEVQLSLTLFVRERYCTYMCSALASMPHPSVVHLYVTTVCGDRQVQKFVLFASAVATIAVLSAAASPSVLLCSRVFPALFRRARSGGLYYLCMCLLAV